MSVVTIIAMAVNTEGRCEVLGVQTMPSEAEPFWAHFHEAVVRRLLGALLLEQNNEYAIQNRYMRRESMATVNENPAIGPPDAPALA